MSENDLNFNNQNIDNNPQNFNEQEAPLINNINNYEPQILNNQIIYLNSKIQMKSKLHQI